ncbi:hypothetical protein U1Q18_029180 [Sarracenia purpurea var. burkii]
MRRGFRFGASFWLQNTEGVDFSADRREGFRQGVSITNETRQLRRLHLYCVASGEATEGSGFGRSSGELSGAV